MYAIISGISGFFNCIKPAYNYQKKSCKKMLCYKLFYRLILMLKNFSFPEILIILYTYTTSKHTSKKVMDKQN